MEDSKPQTSGLSSRLRTKHNKPQTTNDDPNEKKYTFYLDVTIPDKLEVPSTEVIVPVTMKVADAVKLALMKFKLQFEPFGISVENNPELYNPRLAKKSGKAKTDMPSLDADQILSQIKINSVSLQVKDEKAVSIGTPATVKSVVVSGVSTPIPIISEKKTTQNIQNQISFQKRQVKEIVQQVTEKPSKPQSTCFSSIC